MKMTSHINDAILNLFSSKLRSVLALLGILVGTASVVAMVSGGELATEEALRQFKKLGTDLLSISLGEAKYQDSGETSEPKVTLKQANSLYSIDKDILAIAPYIQLFDRIQFNGQELNSGILAVTKDLSKIVHIDMQHGRFISNLDGRAFYCVIGEAVQNELKKISSRSLLGQSLKIGNNFFTIIGVAKSWEENSFIYADINHSVMIPILTSSILNKEASINNIIMRLSPNANIDLVKTNIETFLSKENKNIPLLFRSAKELIMNMNKQSKIFTVFLGLIGSVSLIVGGIGVMNIMLVSVVERRREIGIRLSVGATAIDIRRLFLVEAVILSLIGGILGMIIGTLITYCMTLFWKWQFTLFLLPLAIGFTVSAAVGIFFGFYPAYKASNLDPIEALRAD